MKGEDKERSGYLQNVEDHSVEEVYQGVKDGEVYENDAAREAVDAQQKDDSVQDYENCGDDVPVPQTDIDDGALDHVDNVVVSSYYAMRELDGGEFLDCETVLTNTDVAEVVVGEAWLIDADSGGIQGPTTSEKYVDPTTDGSMQSEADDGLDVERKLTRILFLSLRGLRMSLLIIEITLFDIVQVS